MTTKKTDVVTEQTVVETPKVEETVSAQPELSARFPFQDARLNLRGDEREQSKYNLLITDPDAKAMLDRLAEQVGFVAKNANGQYYVTCTTSGQSVMEMRRSGKGHKGLLVSGELTIVDVDANGQPLGHFDLDRGGVRIATILDGGIVKQATTRETITGPSANGLRSLRSVRGR